MPDEARIMTLHPDGKQGVNMRQWQYELVRDFILTKLSQHSTLSFQELGHMASVELDEPFSGKVLWHLTTVKLDLEARGLIERVPKKSPQQLRLVQ